MCLLLCHGEVIGNEGQPGRLGDRLQLVNEGGDVVRGLAPRHIGSINRASPAGRIPGSWALHFAFFDAGSPNALSHDDNRFWLRELVYTSWSGQTAVPTMPPGAFSGN